MSSIDLHSVFLISELFYLVKDVSENFKLEGELRQVEFVFFDT
jgi:hypothetical protein